MSSFTLLNIVGATAEIVISLPHSGQAVVNFNLSDEDC